ncbi:MAG: hypothetical protein QF803_06505 [Gammaproteobacteria bacterium]|nr:hypothetical protein [Gammaproteobacteria bacterium]MDP6695258.1 hypothetical protein [Gammaproteobacteria bacterium]
MPTTMTASGTETGSTRGPITATGDIPGMGVATVTRHINATAGMTQTGAITGVASTARIVAITIVIAVRIVGIIAGATIVITVITAISIITVITGIIAAPGADRLSWDTVTVTMPTLTHRAGT